HRGGCWLQRELPLGRLVDRQGQGSDESDRRGSVVPLEVLESQERVIRRDSVRRVRIPPVAGPPLTARPVGFGLGPIQQIRYDGDRFENTISHYNGFQPGTGLPKTVRVMS